jgi:hypothetical protein
MKKSQNSSKQGFFLLFLLDDRIRIRTSGQRIRIQEAQNPYGYYGSGSATLVYNISILKVHKLEVHTNFEKRWIKTSFKKIFSKVCDPDPNFFENAGSQDQVSDPPPC